MSSPELERDVLDPDVCNFISIFGRKGSGKSVRARKIYEFWPAPALLIDVIGDVDPIGPDGKPLRAIREVPERWPTHEVDGHTELVPRLWYVPDQSSPSHMQEMDQAGGLAYRTGDCLVWLAEVHVILPVHSAGRMPQARRALIQGRHRNLSMMSCGPRPRDIDKLVLQQSDHILTYHLPNPDDRQYIAEMGGCPRKVFEAEHARLGRHEYLWLNVKGHRLTHYDPVDDARPRARLKETAEWR